MLALGAAEFSDVAEFRLHELQQQRQVQQQQEEQQRKFIAAELDVLRQHQSRGSLEVQQTGSALDEMRQVIKQLQADLQQEKEQRAAL